MIESHIKKLNILKKSIQSLGNYELIKNSFLRDATLFRSLKHGEIKIRLAEKTSYGWRVVGERHADLETKMTLDDKNVWIQHININPQYRNLGYAKDMTIALLREVQNNNGIVVSDWSCSDQAKKANLALGSISGIKIKPIIFQDRRYKFIKDDFDIYDHLYFLNKNLLDKDKLFRFYKNKIIDIEEISKNIKSTPYYSTTISLPTKTVSNEIVDRDFFIFASIAIELVDNSIIPSIPVFDISDFHDSGRSLEVSDLEQKRFKLLQEIDYHSSPYKGRKPIMDKWKDIHKESMKWFEDNKKDIEYAYHKEYGSEYYKERFTGELASFLDFKKNISDYNLTILKSYGLELPYSPLEYRKAIADHSYDDKQKIYLEELEKIENEIDSLTKEDKRRDDLVTRIRFGK